MCVIKFFIQIISKKLTLKMKHIQKYFIVFLVCFYIKESFSFLLYHKLRLNLYLDEKIRLLITIFA